MGRPTAGAEERTLRPRRVSRQKEAGEATRRETRRRLLAAAKAEFAERGYAAATVIRIAERADVSVQTLYSNWGNKRNLLRAVMESSVTGDEDLPLVAGEPPAVFAATTAARARQTTAVTAPGRAVPRCTAPTAREAGGRGFAELIFGSFVTVIYDLE